KKCEYEHREEGLDDCPRSSEQRLFVTDFDIAPGQEIEQLPIRPKIRKVEWQPFGGRLNSHNGSLWQAIFDLNHLGDKLGIDRCSDLLCTVHTSHDLMNQGPKRATAGRWIAWRQWFQYLLNLR